MEGGSYHTHLLNAELYIFPAGGGTGEAKGSLAYAEDGNHLELSGLVYEVAMGVLI